MPIEHTQRETDLFEAKGSDGALYTVVEHRPYVLLTKFAGDREPVTVAGKREYVTWPDGRLIKVSGERMELADTKVLLRRL